MKIVWTTSSLAIDEFPPQWHVVPNPQGRRLSEDEARDLLRREQPDGILAGTEPLTESVLSAAPNLKVISRCGVGLDSIDLDAAKRLGIEVRNTPEAPVASVAELAVALILNLLRKVSAIDARMKKRQWYRPPGALLQGKTVAILGCGRIGSYVAGLLTGFGSTIIGYDPFLDSHPDINLVDLDSIWEQADIISLHMQSTEATRRMINAHALARMKDSALLVNTARGALIDEQALKEALEGGILAGAALDVYEEEPYAGPLTEVGERILLTSHIASSAAESRMLMEREALDNLIDALEEIG